MKVEHVRGKNKGKIMLYALSTCGWCHKTKELLNDLGVEYYYIFVDQLEDSEKEQQMREVSKYNHHRSFPTLVINNDKCIVGFKEDEIKEALGK
ncbi:MAG: NrdH-redoxin [Euryarchaeota archaeon RBG_13_31_8]|nr:MAG: NrdH-redoxin [Euryarchaeota archaeon RBG_13_31_8]